MENLKTNETPNSNGEPCGTCDSCIKHEAYNSIVDKIDSSTLVADFMDKSCNTIDNSTLMIDTTAGVKSINITVIL